MNRGKIIVFSLIVVFIIILSYVLYQLNKINKAVFKFGGARINSLSPLSLTVFLKMVNEGSMAVTISNQEYDIYLNDKFVSHMKYSQPFKIRPGMNLMPLEVSIKLADVIKAGWSNLSQLLNDKSKVNIKLQGSYDLKIGFIQVGKRMFSEVFNLGEMQKQESGYGKACACPAAPPGVKDDWCWCTKKNEEFERDRESFYQSVPPVMDIPYSYKKRSWSMNNM